MSEAEVTNSDSYPIGIVIGSYNMPDMVELQLASIRACCGQVPIMISDDCSDGMEPTPEAASNFGRLVALAGRSPSVYLWPNVERIGHAGGDMAAIWKAIIWGAAMRFDVVFKISQRFIIDVANWASDGAALLMRSGLSTLTRACPPPGFPIRTEAIGFRVDRWHRADILAHLTPRRIGHPTELVLYDDLVERLEGRFCQWDLMSESRESPTAGVLFHAANSQAEYLSLAQRYGLQWPSCDLRQSFQMEGYRFG